MTLFENAFPPNLGVAYSGSVQIQVKSFNNISYLNKMRPSSILKMTVSLDSSAKKTIADVFGKDIIRMKSVTGYTKSSNKAVTDQSR